MIVKTVGNSFQSQARRSRLQSHRWRLRRSLEWLEDRRMLSFVDADNSGTFTAGDVDVTAEVADGVFDTDRIDGAYTPVIQNAGLVIEEAITVVAGNIRFKADRDLLIELDLDAGRSIELVSRAEDVSVFAFINALNAGDSVTITAFGNFIPGGGDSITAGRDVNLKAGNDVGVDFMTITAGRDVEVSARGKINADGATINADKEVEVSARGDISALNVVINAIGTKGSVEIEARGDIDVSGALTAITATKSIELEAEGDLTAIDATLTTTGSEIELESGGNLDASGAIILAKGTEGEVEIEARENVTLNGAIIHAEGAKGEVGIEARGDVTLNGASVIADKEIEIAARGLITAHDVILRAERGEVSVKAGGDVDLSAALAGGTVVRALKEIEIVSKLGNVTVANADIANFDGSTKGTITLKASKGAGTVDVDGAELTFFKKLTIEGTKTGVAIENGPGQTKA